MVCETKLTKPTPTRTYLPYLPLPNSLSSLLITTPAHKLFFLPTISLNTNPPPQTGPFPITLYLICTLSSCSTDSLSRSHSSCCRRNHELSSVKFPVALYPTIAYRQLLRTPPSPKSRAPLRKNNPKRIHTDNHDYSSGDFGLIGLAVMGQNLILNAADHGFTVVAFNRTVAKVDHFLANEAKGWCICGETHTNVANGSILTLFECF